MKLKLSLAIWWLVMVKLGYLDVSMFHVFIFFGNYKDTPKMGPFFSYSDHPHFKRGNKKMIISPVGLSTVTNYDFSDRQYLSNRKKRVHFQARMDLNKTVMPSRPAALILQTILLILMSCPQPECVARILKAMHPKYWKSSFRSPDIEPVQWSDEMRQDFFRSNANPQSQLFCFSFSFPVTFYSK